MSSLEHEGPALSKTKLLFPSFYVVEQGDRRLLRHGFIDRRGLLLCHVNLRGRCREVRDDSRTSMGAPT